MADQLEGRDLTRRILLALLGVGGEIVESFLDPYERLKLVSLFLDEGRLQRFKLMRKLRALESQNLISIKEKKNEITVTLTSQGENKALRYRLDDLKIAKPDWWDRKWRLVLFDIPEPKKVARNYFKLKLTDLGFFPLQHSVYIHPYECHNEIEFIRNIYGIKDNVKMLIVDKLEGEAILRKHFDL